MDPQNLNKLFLREHYKLTTFQNLYGSKASSTLDVNKLFWQITFKKASLLTIFATLFGCYRFLRLPRLEHPPELLHRIFTGIFQGIDNIKIYIFDIAVYFSVCYKEVPSCEVNNLPSAIH